MLMRAEEDTLDLTVMEHDIAILHRAYFPCVRTEQRVAPSLHDPRPANEL